MKIRVTIEAEIPDEVPGYADPLNAVRMTIVDALSDFQTKRSPPIAWVTKHYSHYDAANKEQKLRQVEVRNHIAVALCTHEVGSFGSFNVTELKGCVHCGKTQTIDTSGTSVPVTTSICMQCFANGKR